MKLPVEFLNKMKDLLGESEFEDFVRSYDMPRHYGLRINTLKVSVEDFLKITPFALESIPWTRDGFYYPQGETPGRHPYYHAGLYYIQEPSAMLPGEVMDAQPGEHVLDLCAAPGGKTVQLAAGMKGKGLLVANDISADRVKALVKNIELCGVRNAIVTNEPPGILAQKFPEYFDKVLVDAPCSGEGMFRKDEDAARSWEKFKCETCAGMQRDILESADRMLKPGGCIVYSTCTFSPEEDEKMISEFIRKHANYEILEIPKVGGVDTGKPDWANGNPDLEKTARLWPHKLKGEGHFVAKLRKKASHSADLTLSSESFPVARFATVATFLEAPRIKAFENATQPKVAMASYLEEHSGSSLVLSGGKSGYNAEKINMDAFNHFVNENLNTAIEGYFQVKGNNLYCLPEAPPDLSGIKVAKFGWYLGEFSRDRFEPSHSMVVSLKKEEVKNVMDFPSGAKEVLSYLKGETLMVEGKKGYTAICVDGLTLGWAKQTGDMLKNLYPKGWRRMS